MTMFSGGTSILSCFRHTILSTVGVCCSGLFIVAPDGTLRQKTVNDLPVGRSVDETLRLVKAFQVCLLLTPVCYA